MQTENFGRNIQLAAVDTYTPGSESEVLEILNRNKGRNIRCVGRLHSWSNVIVAKDVLLDLRKLCSVNPVQDGEQKYVDVGAGCQIKKTAAKIAVAKKLDFAICGLHNRADYRWGDFYRNARLRQAFAFTLCRECSGRMLRFNDRISNRPRNYRG
jgi:hypothetical protein